MRQRFTPYIYILLLLWGLIPGKSYTQGVNIGNPPLRNFSKKAYKAGTQNWDAAQDSRGVMYWANNDGLLQFDGTNWTVLPVANHTIVRSVAIDSSDIIYTGAQSEIGYFAPNPNGQLTYHSLVDLLPQDQRSFEDVWDIVSYNGDVFFRTNHLIFQYKAGKLKILNPGGELTALFLTHEGLFVQKDLSDLLRFQNGNFEAYMVIPGLKSAITGAMAWTADSTILSTLKQGLFYQTGRQLGHWATPYDDMLMEKRIYSSTALQNGNLALGTSLDGLLVMDRQRRIYRHLSKKSGLQNNNILNSYNDKAGNVWLGLDNGIDCLILESFFTSIFPDVDLQGTGYTAAVFDHRLYLGVSNGAYVAPWQSFYDPQKGSVFQKVTGSDGQVWNFNILDDQLMMGHHEGAFRIDGNTSEPLTSGTGAWTFVQLADGYMLGGTYTGLALYRKTDRGWKFDRKLEGLNESCRIMVKDEEGAIWVSHPYRGLYHIHWSPKDVYRLEVSFYDQDNGLPSNLNNYVFQIAGKAFFATEKGVYQFNSQTDRFVRDEDFSRLLGSDRWVKYLKEDAKGNVWYVTDEEVGVLLVDDYGLKKEVRKKSFPELLGKMVGGFECIYPIDEHNVIIGSEQGFIHYTMGTPATGDTTLLIVLSSVHVTGTQDSLLFGGFSHTNEAAADDDVPVLEAGMNNLSFAYSATDYSNPSLIEYRVMLEGLEKSWSSWSSENRRNYTNLSAGNYSFNVQARIKDGRVSEVVSYAFRIRPPWYKSKAALLLYGLGLMGFFAGVVFKQRRQFESEKAQMTESHQQKEAQHMLEVEQSKAVINEIQNEKLEVEIKFKNQELALTTMHLVQKAEILLTVQEALNQIHEKAKTPEVKKDIQQLLNLLNFDVKLDEDWEQFAYHFDQVHVDFLKHLREQFPQLSSNDYKLCAYLRMNLSTKEIAPLLNISVRGVEGSRYRLRRKLNLPNDANLTEFILNLPPAVSTNQVI